MPMSGVNPNAKSYNVLPGPVMGVVTADYLENLARVIRKHQIPLVKLTSAQRLAIAGHEPEALAEIWRDLGRSDAPAKPVGIHYIQACPGVQWCKFGRQDSLALGEKLSAALMALPLPAKTKVGISGCPMNCCECYVRDLGIFGKKNGWTLVFGGNGGGVPRLADVIAEGLHDDEVIALAERCLRYFAANARKMERTGRLMRRTDLEAFKEAVL
ncbi:MAG: hypothetical protein OEV73_11160 [Desulfobulbaceae bacterium]|nr:hypothetical protein [Desulfobulbaceae bacterium]